VCFSMDAVCRCAPESRGVRARESGGQPSKVKSQIGLRDKSVKSVSSVVPESNARSLVLSAWCCLGVGGGYQYQATSFRDTNWCTSRPAGARFALLLPFRKGLVFQPRELRGGIHRLR